jgi:hypothetical protein
MTNSAQAHGKQEPETVEDLAPREDESAELKGGTNLGGGAGRTASGGGGGAGKVGE